MYSLISRTDSRYIGSCSSSDIMCLYCALRIPLLFHRKRLTSNIHAHCAVNALVEATPISVPALVNKPLSVRRAIVDQGTLTNQNVFPPRSFICFKQAILSAVSPD